MEEQNLRGILLIDPEYQISVCSITNSGNIFIAKVEWICPKCQELFSGEFSWKDMITFQDLASEVAIFIEQSLDLCPGCNSEN